MVAPWPKGTLVRAVALALFACAASSTATRALAAPAAVVLERAGVVWVTPPGGARRVLLVLDPLYERSRIEVSKDARAVVFFARGGQTWTVDGESSVEVQTDVLLPLTGAPPTLHATDPANAVRLRPEGLVLGGVVMRHVPGAALQQARACSPLATADEIARREPAAEAPSGSRVLFALWLEDVCAREDANRVWRALSRELPFDDAIQRRIR